MDFTVINALPTPPQSSDTQAVFDARADAMVSALNPFVSQTNNLALEINTFSRSLGFSFIGHSTTSQTIGFGVLNFIVEPSLGYATGNFLKIASAASASNNMYATVIAYNVTTGAISVNVDSKNGSGTFSDWVFSLSAPANSAISGTEFVVATGTSAAYSIAPINSIGAYIEGMAWDVKFPVACADSPVASVSGLANINIVILSPDGSYKNAAARDIMLATVSTVQVVDVGAGVLKLWVKDPAIDYVRTTNNKIIGGDFSTNPWQRGTNFPAVANGSYTADRFIYGKVGSMVHTASKSADAPSAAQAGLYTGFSHSLVVTAAQTTLPAGDICSFDQRIEGLSAAPLGFGQGAARTITKSFWVKMARTGVHCVGVRNAAANRSYVAEYTIIAANTWEFKSITIPVDTSGIWTYDNTVGLSLSFILAAGTTFQTTPNSWQAGNFLATANQVNELDVVGNTFKIALVQLESGPVATPFEARDVGRELALCEWYYRILTLRLGGYHTAGNLIRAQINYPTMRVSPTIGILSTTELVNLSTVNRDSITRTGFRLTASLSATGDAFLTQDITLNAEL